MMLLAIAMILTGQLVATCALLIICSAIYQVGLRIESAISEEGFKASESALETGTLPIFTFLREKLAFLKRWPERIVPKY